MKFPQFPSSVIWWFPEIGVPPDHPNFNGIFFYKLSLWGYPHDYGNLHHSQNSHDNQPTLPMRCRLCRFFSRGTTSTAMPATAVRRWRLVSRLPQAPWGTKSVTTRHDASRGSHRYEMRSVIPSLVHTKHPLNETMVFRR